AGIQFERKVFAQILASDQSRALRHAFFGERAASKIPDVPDNTPLRKVDKVAVIGAGTMGGGIAMCFLNAGVPVIMLEMKQEAIERGLGIIRKNYEAQVSKGKLAQDKYEARMALLTTTLSYADIADADMVIEAVFEDLGVKSSVFKTLDDVMKPGAILASNTSTLDVDKIAEVTKRPGDVVGLHFFSPANVMRLLEVVRSKHTDKDVMATVMAVAKKIKKVAVVSGVCDGFIGNRMFEQYTRQAFFLVEEGATVPQVDKAAEAFGFAMGPFRVGDLAGNDIGWAIRKRRYVEQPDVMYSKVGDAICELGRFGQKAGKGWYDYEVGKREPVPSAEVQACIDKVRADKGITARAISDEEIVNRLVLSMVNEGARILEEGIANKASDLDMVYLTGYGFPIYRGGPMLYADMLGLSKVVEMMKAFQQNPHDDAKFWEPAPLLSKLAAEGKTFN
ncbi:MAG: 3-hydroxyacyl-CoA dehydrogenase NAD-binding domain-containing protein, partial [Pseudomonadota bacterium]